SIWSTIWTTKFEANMTTKQDNNVALVFKHLRERIITRQLEPGTRIKERDVADELQVSRAVVRDALGILAERRLIVRPPNRGAEVARIDEQEIIMIYEAREALEGVAAQLAAERAPENA